MFQDYVLNGRGEGEVGESLHGCHFDPGFLRPYIAKDGRKYVTVNDGTQSYSDDLGQMVSNKKVVPVSELQINGLGNAVTNATLSLRTDEWKQMDQIVIKAARQRLRAWSDLAASNSFGGFNAMGRMILEHETMNDPGEAHVDMDGLTEGRGDAPKFQLEGLPLPITHSDFHFSSRRLAISRNGGMPLDTSMAEAAGRRVAELIEKTTIGVVTGATYGNTSEYGNAPTVYGYTNHPDRVTKTNFTASSSATGTNFVDETLALRELMYANNFYGPFMMYVSTGYDAILDEDFKTNSDKTTRQRVKEIDGIVDVRRLDYLTGDVVLLVQMTSDVARAINGMPITTVQWESKGGMQLNFKVMAIQVPQIRSDFSGNCGVGHGTTS